MNTKIFSFIVLIAGVSIHALIAISNIWLCDKGEKPVMKTLTTIPGDNEYVISYDVPFYTTVDYKRIHATGEDYSAIIEIKDQDFLLEINIMSPPDLGFFTKESTSDIYDTIELPNTSTKVIRLRDLDSKESNRYVYYEFQERFFGKDPWCSEDECPEADRFTFRDGIRIDDAITEDWIFATCDSGTNLGIEKCDEVLKAIDIEKSI